MANENNNTQSFPRPGRLNNRAAVRLLIDEAYRFSSESLMQRSRQSRFCGFEERDTPSEREPSTVVGLFPLIQRFFILLFLILFLIIISVVEYCIFYRIFIPGLQTSEILWFDYSITKHVGKTCGRNANSDSTSATNLMSFTQQYATSESAVGPVAFVDLFTNYQWQNNIPDIIPKLKSKKHILTKGVPHYIEVVLDLPESDLNLKKVGMFTVMVELESETFKANSHSINEKTNKLLATSTRTVRIPFESSWIANFRKVASLFFHVTGIFQENKRIVVPSYRNFIESENFPLTTVTVRLLMAPEKTKRGEIVEVDRAWLNIGRELTDVQLILKEWFFICLTIGSVFLFSMQLVLILAFRHFLKVSRQRSYVVLEDDASNNLDLDDIDDIPFHGSFGQDETGSFHEFDHEQDWEDLPTNHSPNNIQTPMANTVNGTESESYGVTNHVLETGDGQVQSESNHTSSTRHTISVSD